MTPAVTSMLVKKTRLTDRQLVVLAAAAQRDDQAVVLPETLKGKARDTLVQALLRRGLVVEDKAKPGQPIWRRDEAAGIDLSLVITSTGLVAVMPDVGAALSEPQAKPVSPTADAAAGDTVAPVVERVASAAAPNLSPRAGSKQAQLVAMRCAEGGCSIDAVSQALGWLPHTTRAALTGLRHKGYTIERVKGADGAGSRHRIVAPVIAVAEAA